MWAEGVVTDPKEVTLADGDEIHGEVAVVLVVDVVVVFVVVAVVVVVVVVAVVFTAGVVTKVVSRKPR